MARIECSSCKLQEYVLEERLVAQGWKKIKGNWVCPSCVSKLLGHWIEGEK
jgi:hypothetical protein